MRSWLAALRIARREARRAKGRSALVVVLIGLPVLALTAAAVSYDMFTLTAEEQLTRELGTADASLMQLADGPVEQLDPSGHAVTGEIDEDLFTGAGLTADGVAALLPAGSRVNPRRYGEVRLTTATGVGVLGAEAFDLADPLVRGIARVTGGRAPADGDEVAVTAPAAARLGVTPGDEIGQPDSTERYLVVGTMEFPDRLRAETVLFHPDAPLVAQWQLHWLVDTPGPVGWDQVPALNQHGLVVHSRAVALDPPAGIDPAEFGPTSSVAAEDLGIGVLVGGLAVLEIVLLAGPAFAVGARRRRRDLALVAAGGGSPAQLRRIVLADGLVLSALAAGAGIALGTAAAFAARPLVEEHLFSARAGGYRVFPLALVAIAALAVGTGLLAALVPAVTAARRPVVAALAGRRGITLSHRRWLVLGMALGGTGAATAGFGAWQVSATIVLAGLVAGQLGLVLCTPAIVGLVARFGARLPLAPRIALRDTARNRSAAAPAISAVMAAVAGAAAAGTVVLSTDHAPTYGYGYPPGTTIVDGPWSWPDQGSAPEVTDADALLAEAERAARATLPVDEVHLVSRPECVSDAERVCGVEVVVPEEHRCPYWAAPLPLSRADQRAASRDPRCDEGDSPAGHTAQVDDGTALAALSGADPAGLSAAAAVLRAGGVVVTDQRYLSDGEVTIRLTRLEVFAGTDTAGGTEPPVTERPDDPVTLPGYLLPIDWEGDPVILSPGAVSALGEEIAPGLLVVSTTRMPTQAEEDAFAAALEAVEGFGWVQRETGSDLAPMLLLVAAAAGLVALGAAAIATGLAAADRRPDLSTLGAVGASPGVRRRLSLSQAGVIAGLGTGLGLLAGLGAATAVLVALNQRYATTWPSPEPYHITVPLPSLAALLVVPLVAMLGAGLLTRSRLPVERRLG